MSTQQIPIRVMVVDDAALARMVISKAIEASGECVVVGTASSGSIALQKIAQITPDLITLDIEMPEMDGIETLRAIKKDYPKLPVLMVSSHTDRGARITLEAMAAGAGDYTLKPAASQGMEGLSEELTQKIRALCKRPTLAKTSANPTARTAQIGLPEGNSRVEVLAIGASTGGPNALSSLLTKMPANFHLPVVITQHMPPLFTRLLAERLSNQGPLPAVEVAAGMPILPGRIHIAPGDYHFEVVRSGVSLVARLHQGPKENSCRPAVDVMLRSLVPIFGPAVLTVILTGMGSDGMRGCEAIRYAGGQVVVQDEMTSIVWGMPGAVAGAGLAQEILPLDLIVEAIVRRCRNDKRESSAICG